MSMTVGAVLEKTQQMEHLLRENFGATGEDLDEYLDSVPGALPSDLARKIRFVATIRTRLMHERGYRYDGDEGDFWWLCNTILSQLSRRAFIVEETAPVQPAPPARVVRREEPSERALPVGHQPDARPWYRSTWVLLALFLFLPPVWAIWMLLDRDQGFLTKGVATIVLLAFSIAGLTAYSLLTSTQSLGSSYTPAVVKRMTTPAATAGESGSQAIAAPTGRPPVMSTPTLTPTGSPSARAAACTIEWQEYKGDTLAGKNRNQVWNGIVKQQVAGSGMAPVKFYATVVEQNPSLAGDGYVFKQGKTYRLPKCK
jgi:hypothetical protein